MKKVIFTFIFIVFLIPGSMVSFANQPANPSSGSGETTDSHSGSFFTGALLIILSLSAGISTKRIYEMRRAAFEELV